MTTKNDDTQFCKPAYINYMRAYVSCWRWKAEKKARSLFPLPN